MGRRNPSMAICPALWLSTNSSFLVEYVIAIERHFYLTVSVYFITYFMKTVNLVKINGLLKISCVNFGKIKKKKCAIWHIIDLQMLIQFYFLTF